MKVITIYPYFWDRGGAPDLALSLAISLNTEPAIVLTNSPSIHSYYLNLDVKFEKFTLKNVWKYYREDAIFISHHRKQTSILVLLNLLLFGNHLRLTHVAHNLFDNLKYFSYFPKNIVAVSNAVKQNLISYFGVKESRIHVIFNGMKDRFRGEEILPIHKDIIKVILPAALFPVKQQVELVKNTKGKISSHIEIFFAGKGPTEAILRKAIGSSKQYKILGFIDIYKELYKYDYVCLFSKKEGLPLSLIDGCMFMKPLITNNIPSVLDVNINGYNGYVLSSWDEVIQYFNSLPFPNTKEYKMLSLNSRQLYEERFTFNKMIHSYRELLAKL